MAYNDVTDTYELEGRIETSTAKATLIEFTNTGEQVWVPKSQIHGQRPSDSKDLFLFDISAWLAKKNNLAS